MESEWDKFLESLNQRIDAKLEPLNKELSNQEELIQKLSKNLANLSEAIQSKCGRLDTSNHKLNNQQEKQKLSEECKDGEHKLTKDEKEEPKEVVETDS